MGYDKRYFLHSYVMILKDKKFYSMENKLAEIKIWGFLDGCKKVLDVGCGLGVNIHGYENAIGIDNAKFAVDFCKKLGIKSFLMDAHKLKFPKNSFDGVICAHTLEKVEDPLRALKEIHRVLKPNGKFVLLLPTVFIKKHETESDLYSWQPADIKHLLKRVGFKKINHKYYNFRAPALSLYFPFKLWLTGSKFIGKFKKPNELAVYALKK